MDNWIRFQNEKAFPTKCTYSNFLKTQNLKFRMALKTQNEKNPMAVESLDCARVITNEVTQRVYFSTFGQLEI